VDRPPFLEEGVREEVLDLWRRQGMPDGKTHVDVFGLTPHENVGPDLKYASGYFGRIFDLSANEYRKAFYVSRRRFPADWAQTVRRLENRDHIACIWASRGFLQALGVGDWPTLEKALIGTVKESERVRDRMEMYGEFCSLMLEQTMKEVDPEFIYLSEPISNNEGPLVSPEMFEEFMIPVYERIVDTAKGLGCDKILLSTYGDTSLLFPNLFDAGVSMLWISEAPDVPGLDYAKIRKEYGPDLGLIGGIPLSILREGSAGRINQTLQEIIPPLLESGRYIPLAGGRVREEIPWGVYEAYRKALVEMMG
jgi:hypothetical protein